MHDPLKSYVWLVEDFIDGRITNTLYEAESAKIMKQVEGEDLQRFFTIYDVLYEYYDEFSEHRIERKMITADDLAVIARMSSEIRAMVAKRPAR